MRKMSGSRATQSLGLTPEAQPTKGKLIHGTPSALETATLQSLRRGGIAPGEQAAHQAPEEGQGSSSSSKGLPPREEASATWGWGAGRRADTAEGKQHGSTDTEAARKRRDDTVSITAHSRAQREQHRRTAHREAALIPGGI